jgi:hypothetical protein
MFNTAKYPSASMIVAQRAVVDYTTKTHRIRLHEPDYCNRVQILRNTQGSGQPNRWMRKLAQNFLTLIHITWLLLNICV